MSYEMIKRYYSDGMCKDCQNDVCKVYGGRCRKYRINRKWNVVKSFVKKWFPYALLYVIVALVITYGWQGLELIFYGEVQHRIVDDIVGYILILSICINAIFCKAIFIPKSEMQKYVALKREEYNNQKSQFKTENGGIKMFIYIILLWILINMNAPGWTYVLLGISAFLSIIRCGIILARKNK